MKLQLIAFGIARDILGGRKISYEVPEPATVGTLLSKLSRDYPQIEGLASIRVAVNEAYAEAEHPLSPSDEIVLIPPVSGG